MPIKIPNTLPAVEVLNRENIFIMREARAQTQDIRPLRIALVNLMPDKITICAASEQYAVANRA